MFYSDKIDIKQLDQTSDYRLWNIRVEAASSMKGVSSENSNPSAVTTALDTNKHTESGIIISSLSDSALHIFRALIGDTVSMFDKLDALLD